MNGQYSLEEYTWLSGDCLDVAPRLLGWELVSRAGGAETSGRIVECEAYRGTADPASHAYRGPTPRTAPMFLAGGYVYVYLSYGVHACINIVTGPAGEGQAILLRALEPLTGLDAMARRRNLTSPLQLTSGPGKLTQALGISLSLSGTHLGAALMLKPPRVDYNPGPIATGPRIGITKATDRPWRYYLRDSPFLSRRSPLE